MQLFTCQLGTKEANPCRKWNNELTLNYKNSLASTVASKSFILNILCLKERRKKFKTNDINSGNSKSSNSSRWKIMYFQWSEILFKLRSMSFKRNVTINVSRERKRDRVWGTEIEKNWKNISFAYKCYNIFDIDIQIKRHGGLAHEREGSGINHMLSNDEIISKSTHIQTKMCVLQSTFTCAPTTKSPNQPERNAKYTNAHKAKH